MSDVVLIISAICVALPPTIIALANLITTIRNGQKMDGRMNELVQATKGQAKAEGALEVIKSVAPTLMTEVAAPVVAPPVPPAPGSPPPAPPPPDAPPAPPAKEG